MLDDRPAFIYYNLQKTVLKGGAKDYGTSCLFDHTFMQVDVEVILPATSSWITEAVLLYIFWWPNFRSLSSILEIPQSYTKQVICIYIYIFSRPARDIVQQIQCHFLKSLRSWDIMSDNYTFPMIYLLLQCDKETQSMINRSRYNIVYIKTLYVEP